MLNVNVNVNVAGGVGGGGAKGHATQSVFTKSLGAEPCAVTVRRHVPCRPYLRLSTHRAADLCDPSRRGVMPE